MKMKILPTFLLLSSFFVVGFLPGRVRGENAPKNSRAQIYDESANGAKQISDALLIAQKEHKRVLLEFGGNSCGACRRLHEVLERDKDVSQKIKSEFVIVMVDAAKGHNRDIEEKYGRPSRVGWPAIVILDADGKQLTTKKTSEFSAGGSNYSEKVMAFLQEWTPARQE